MNGILSIALLAIGMLATTSFYLFKKQSFFDDSFIYLHMAVNIVESGTARYFPVSGSSLLLASSPLRLLTLVPGIFFLDVFGIPLRTIESAKFAFLTSGFVAFLVFLPFWTKNLKLYFAVSGAFFLLGSSLDSLFLMEGGVLFFSLATLTKLLIQRADNKFIVGVATLLLGISRPEIGAIAFIVTLLVYIKDRKALRHYIGGIAVSFAVYWLIMSFLQVYPIPSTIWSKQITGKLKLFSDKNLIGVLPINIAELIGMHKGWVGWIFILLPFAFSLPMKRTAILVGISSGALLLIARSMPGNFTWYSENFMLFILALGCAVASELYKSYSKAMSYVLSAVLLCFTALVLISNFGINKPYPWNENSRGYLAYREIGNSVSGAGAYVIKPYSSEPVRIRMCEIGIAAYFSGKNGWIYDICGLAQIGNLAGASKSWLRYLYPASFIESGDDQVKRFSDHDKLDIIDIWALRSDEEVAGAKGKCQYVDDKFCINRYRERAPAGGNP